MSNQYLSEISARFFADLPIPTQSRLPLCRLILCFAVVVVGGYWRALLLLHNISFPIFEVSQTNKWMAAAATVNVTRKRVEGRWGKISGITEFFTPVSRAQVVAVVPLLMTTTRTMTMALDAEGIH